MLRIRIVMVAALAALVLVGGGASAQTRDQAGPPLKLLAGLRPPHEAKAHQAKAGAHAKIARKASHRKLAARAERGKRHSTAAVAQFEAAPAQSAPATPAPDVPLAAAPAIAPATPLQAPINSAATTPTDNGARPNTVTFEGQTVQVESPSQVNTLDLAADQIGAAPTSPAPSDRTEAVLPAQTVLAAPVHQDASQNADGVGSASWIAQVLAALGGAVAAGVVAWFLIGSGPVRIYG